MPAQQYQLPIEQAADKDGSDVTSVWVPGTGSVPILGDAAQTNVEAGSLGSVTAAPMQVGQGGSFYVDCPAATAQLVKTGAGRCCTIIVLATGTAAVNIYDNTTASGQVIYPMQANPTVGQIFVINVPVTKGIFVGGATNTPHLLVMAS